MNVEMVQVSIQYFKFHWKKQTFLYFFDNEFLNTSLSHWYLQKITLKKLHLLGKLPQAYRSVNRWLLNFSASKQNRRNPQPPVDQFCKFTIFNPNKVSFFLVGFYKTTNHNKPSLFKKKTVNFQI